MEKWKKVIYKKKAFKISAPRRHEEFELRSGSYFVSDIPDYFTYIIKKHETVTDNPSMMRYMYKIQDN